MNRRRFIALTGGGLGIGGVGGTTTAASTRATAGRQDPALFEVRTLGTNSPIGPNELLEVQATIENVGGETGTTDIELIVGHDPQVEDSQFLTLEPGERRTITLTFRAGEPSGGSETFPIEVDTGAHAATEMVTVEAEAGDPAFFELQHLWTNSPVDPNAVLEVQAIVENVGGETGRTDIELVVGHDPEVEDRQYLTLEPGERRTITLEFRAGEPAGGRETFPIEVDTGAHAATEMVTVVEGDPALFEVEHVWTNSPVGPSEVLEAWAWIRNVGGERGRTDVELVVGHDPEIEDRQYLTLEPNEQGRVILEFRAGVPAGEREEFPIEVDTGAHSTTEMVAVVA